MSRPMPRVLIADPDPEGAGPLADLLRAEGLEVELAGDAEEVLARVREEPADLVVLDAELPPAGGLAALNRLHAYDPEMVVILATGFGTVHDAVAAVRQGAFDYIAKPLLEDEARLAIHRALDRSHLSRRLRTLKAEVEGRFGFASLLAGDPRMKEVLAVAAAVADSKATVLLTGESGTGKTLLARAIHQRSPRCDGPFVEVTCGALPENLLESELFGHVKGSFTGATRDKPGKFELAQGGTIFLDEIATASPALQVKLLGVLQDRLVDRVGGDAPRAVDVRIILATHVDLAGAVRQGTFREDLFYRINVVSLEIPPLRERPGDILHLARHFLRAFGQEYGKPTLELGPQAAARVLAWSWPGNVRELQNAMERAVVLCPGPEVRPADLPPWIQPAPAGRNQEPQAEPAPEGGLLPLREALERFERVHLGLALRAAGGNRSQAARLLGIDRTTLFHKLRRHGLQGGSEVAPGGGAR